MEQKAPKILLIEDDTFMIELLVMELKKAGFDVTVARTGHEGVEEYKKAVPDLILLDLLLPDQNGFEALREIRRMPEGPQTKVVVLSNLSESQHIEEAKRLGTLDYLVKTNHTLPEIAAKVKQALGM